MTGRDDLAWCTPDSLPEELLAFDGTVQDGLTVGAAGKTGVLDLELAPLAGSTKVVRQYQRAPLHIFRPIYLDPARPDMAFVFLQQQGDGLVQGDRYRMDIDCAPGSAVHITTQAATKVFGARDNFATQLVNLRVGAGAVLEYLPDPVVPFRTSRLFQRTCLTTAPDATVIMGEILLPGRVAHGEAHAYDLCWMETEVRSPDGTLLFTDTVRLRPGGQDDPRSPGLLGEYDVVATMYVVASRMPPADLVLLLRGALAEVPDVLAGVTELPADCGAAVRVLGHTSRAVQT
ncbi:urease accessory protein UreD, partial [Streptomyces violaceoruber]